MYVFPRVRYYDHFLRDGPVGSVGTGNLSGWMQDETFISFLKQFQKHVNASHSHRVLLVLDNRSFHIHIKSLDFCKDNSIILLSIPPHCSHKLQPFDRSVYGPFKKALQPPYEGPFPVLQRKEKTFLVPMLGRTKELSVDRFVGSLANRGAVY
jgi:hypothetical protein